MIKYILQAIVILLISIGAVYFRYHVICEGNIKCLFY